MPGFGSRAGSEIPAVSKRDRRGYEPAEGRHLRHRPIGTGTLRSGRLFRRSDQTHRPAVSGRSGRRPGCTICAVVADEDFKRRYVLESVDWYLDLSPEIPPAVKALAESMETPLAELPFLYEPVETWKIKAKSELTKQKEKSL